MILNRRLSQNHRSIFLVLGLVVDANLGGVERGGRFAEEFNQGTVPICTRLLSGPSTKLGFRGSGWLIAPNRVCVGGRLGVFRIIDIQFLVCSL